MLITTRTTIWFGSILAILLVQTLNTIDAQENAQLQIPPSLLECYNTSYYMNRANRLPANINTFISLIEKIENSGYNDLRTLSVSLLHRFRQDGIQRAPNVAESLGVIPYSPTGFQFSKFRLLLTRLIPGNAITFPNDTLTSQERCSLHFMLSSSFDLQSRGDEGQVCNKLSQYRAHRVPRSSAQERNNFIGDVELLETLNTQTRSRTKQLRVNPYAQTLDSDFSWSDVEYGSNDISQCPVENGVIWTKWGTVAAGNLIAGIAAGAQPQTIQLRTLLALARRRGGTNLPQVATVAIDNRWAATLAGDLAEVALVQVPASTNNAASVGATGAWNSTAVPKWYFLSQRTNLEMTDAEIRGDLDGLTLAMNISNWRTQVSSLKLSQLLRMYYSMDGVLDSGVRACNRKNNFVNVAPYETMVAQTSAFAQVLDREMQLRVTLSPSAIANFSANAATALQTYVPSSLNDVSCAVSSESGSLTITPMTNIYVYLDTSWSYNDIVDYVSAVLEGLNINYYASQVTMISASDGSIMVNTTNYLPYVFEVWNQTTHSQFTTGFNLPTVLRSVQNLTQSYMNAQQTNSSVGGRSMVALLMPNTASVSSGDSSYSTTQLQYISEQIPDLYFIYYGGGSINRFSQFVKDSSQDLYTLNYGTDAAISAKPVIQRIKKIPRRIINPRCGSGWYTSTWGTDTMQQYARNGVINFYRMVPNYFYGNANGRYVNIQAQSGFQFTICTSRSTVLPMPNSTSSDVNCIATNSNQYSYDLTNPCNGYTTIHQCPPLYISVSPNSTSTTVSCSQAACQTADQLSYTVSVVNLSCYSGVAGLLASFGTILMAYILSQLL